MPTDRVHCRRGQVNLWSVNDGASCVEKRHGMNTAPSLAVLDAPAAVGGQDKGCGPRYPQLFARVVVYPQGMSFLVCCVCGAVTIEL